MNNNYLKDREIKLSKITEWFKEGHIPLIINSTKDKDPIVRAEALIKIGYTGDSNYIQNIIPLLKDEDQHVRYTAIQILDLLGPSEALEELLTVARESSEFVKCQAIKALGKIHKDEALKFLVEMLLDPSENVCTEAAASLEKMLTFKKAQEVLSSLFEDDELLQEKYNKLYQMLKRRIKIGKLF